jgi:hypothetical protein
VTPQCCPPYLLTAPSDSRLTAPTASRGRALRTAPTGLLLHPTRIFDVANAEAFVERTIQASGISYRADEREELLAEGLVILLELAERYRPLPARPGIDKQAGRFSGYAAMFLPRRLGDAWHRWHPEHRYITDPATGRRRWHYDPAAISLDGLYGGSDTSRGGDASHSGDAALAHARVLRDFVPTSHAVTVPLAT